MECLVMLGGEQERHLDPVLMNLADQLTEGSRHGHQAGAHHPGVGRRRGGTGTAEEAFRAWIAEVSRRGEREG
jgi:hypothetical protein